MHISSIVVHAEPARLGGIQAHIDAVEALQTHVCTEDGRMVVTVETPDESSSIALIDGLRLLPGVHAVAMVFHQFEPDPDQEV